MNEEEQSLGLHKFEIIDTGYEATHIQTTWKTFDEEIMENYYSLFEKRDEVFKNRQPRKRLLLSHY